MLLVLFTYRTLLQNFQNIIQQFEPSKVAMFKKKVLKQTFLILDFQLKILVTTREKNAGIENLPT